MDARKGNTMKTLNTRKLLGFALMGAFAISPFLVPSAQADPPRNAPAYGRRAKDKKDKRYEKEERREERRDREDYDRDRYDRDRDYRDRYNRDQRNKRNNASFNGTVVNVRSGNSFDLRANGRIYNVYTSSTLPRGLSKNDEVRVSGRPYGDNDVRNASVRITKNSRNTPRPNNNGQRYQTYRGTVTSVRNDREFDVRIGGKIYNVYAASGTRGLNKNDEVRIYGTRFGDNDIRNSKVVITRNR